MGLGKRIFHAGKRDGVQFCYFVWREVGFGRRAARRPSDLGKDGGFIRDDQAASFYGHLPCVWQWRSRPGFLTRSIWQTQIKTSRYCPEMRNERVIVEHVARLSLTCSSPISQLEARNETSLCLKLDGWR